MVALIVATPGVLLEYVIAPLLALAGAGAVMPNGASPYVVDAGTVNVDSVGVPSETVSVLLVTAGGAAYWAVAAWVAVNVSVPALCSVITPVVASIVATPGALLVYVIAPLLSLVGAGAVMSNGASPYVFRVGTVNVDSVGLSNAITRAIPLELMPSPPYNV